MGWVVAVAAVVQALAAVAIWRLTRGLVDATQDYVRETGQLVERTSEMATEAKRGNDLASIQFNRVLRAEAPVLTVTSSGTEIKEDVSTFRFDLRNLGPRAAHHVALIFADPTAQVPGPSLPPEMQGPAFYPVNLQVPSGDLREGNPAPRLVSVIFQDSNGTPWIQMAVNGTELDLPEFDEIRM